MPSRRARRSSPRWSPLLLAVALAVALVAPATAQPSSDEVRTELRSAQDRLDELEVEIGAVVDAYNDAQAALDAVSAQAASTEAELLALTDDADELRRVVQDHVRRLHKLGPTIEFSSVLVAGDPSETGARVAAIRRIIEGQQSDLEAFDALQVALAATEQRLGDQRAQAQDLADELTERRSEVESTIAGKQAEIDRLNAELRTALDREEAERRAAEERRARLAAQQAERERQAQLVASRSVTSSDASSGGASTSGGSTGSGGSAGPGGPSAPSPSPAPAPRSSADVAVQAALSKLGTPYRWGATGPNAFDCSGLMVWAWGQAGVSLPRTSAGQFAGLRRITRAELRPGDLVFAGSPNVHHVGMYIGNGQIVHAPFTGSTVSIRSMNRPDIRGFGRPGV